MVIDCHLKSPPSIASFGHLLRSTPSVASFGCLLWLPPLVDTFGRLLWPTPLEDSFHQLLWQICLTDYFGQHLWPTPLARPEIVKKPKNVDKKIRQLLYSMYIQTFFPKDIVKSQFHVIFDKLKAEIAIASLLCQTKQPKNNLLELKTATKSPSVKSCNLHKKGRIL